VGEEGPVTMEDAAALLFGVMMVGDERCVDETWILGERAYKKA
jgi:guanine deaminase